MVSLKDSGLKACADALIKAGKPRMAKTIVYYWARSENSWIGTEHPSKFEEQRREIENTCLEYGITIDF